MATTVFGTVVSVGNVWHVDLQVDWHMEGQDLVFDNFAYVNLSPNGARTETGLTFRLGVGGGNREIQMPGDNGYTGGYADSFPSSTAEINAHRGERINVGAGGGQLYVFYGDDPARARGSGAIPAARAYYPIGGTPNVPSTDQPIEWMPGSVFVDGDWRKNQPPGGMQIFVDGDWRPDLYGVKMENSGERIKDPGLRVWVDGAWRADAQ